MIKADKDIIDWLLQGDPSIRWQTMKDLLNEKRDKYLTERKRLSRQGWGKRLLDLQDPSGLWADALYSRKWISTTYTMLLLKRLGLDPDNKKARKACEQLLNQGHFSDGGINYFKSLKCSETCISGLVLSLLCYFNYKDERTFQVIEYLLKEQMSDGGWNCERYKGAVHSSFHTTINVLEGLYEYLRKYKKMNDKVRKSCNRAIAFMLKHSLYKSHRTGQTVDPRMIRFAHPPRWHYDIFRFLDLMQTEKIGYNPKMKDALEILKTKQLKTGQWNLELWYQGKKYFQMEGVGKPSRWNTLRALRILKWFDKKGGFHA